MIQGWRAAAILAGLGAVLAGCDEDQEPTRPEVISVESPFRYPMALWDEGVEGEAVVMVHVTDRGAVDSVFILEESGRPELDSAAVAGARQLRFAPGRLGDRRVATWAKLPVRFRIGRARQGGSP